MAPSRGWFWITDLVRQNSLGVRLIFVRDRFAFVVLSGAKHLANEGNGRQPSDAAQIFRCRSELALSEVEGMTTQGPNRPHKT